MFLTNSNERPVTTQRKKQLNLYKKIMQNSNSSSKSQVFDLYEFMMIAGIMVKISTFCNKSSFYQVEMAGLKLLCLEEVTVFHYWYHETTTPSIIVEKKLRFPNFFQCPCSRLLLFLFDLEQPLLTQNQILVFDHSKSLIS